MSALKNRLKQLLYDARRSASVPQRHTLPGGLTLQITQEKNGDVVLMLERRDLRPSLVEWDTVLKYWPEAKPAGILPCLNHKGHVYRLIARWPRPLAPAAENAAEQQPAA